MKTTLIALLLAASACITHAAPPTVQSVEELLTISKTKELLDSSSGTIERYVRQGMVAAAGARPLSAQQQRMLEVLPAKIVAAVQPEFGWEGMKDEYVEIYRKSFSQEEVDALVQFYKSPVGEMLIARMPAVMENSMQVMQVRLAAVMPRIQAAVAAAMAEVKAAK